MAVIERVARVPAPPMTNKQRHAEWASKYYLVAFDEIFGRNYEKTETLDGRYPSDESNMGFNYEY